VQDNATAHTANNSVDTSDEDWWMSHKLRIVVSVITRLKILAICEAHQEIKCVWKIQTL
jgi:hypothetical protein